MSYTEVGRKCDCCGMLNIYMEWCLFHNNKQRHFCKLDCLRFFLVNYEEKKK